MNEQLGGGGGDDDVASREECRNCILNVGRLLHAVVWDNSDDNKNAVLMIEVGAPPTGESSAVATFNISACKDVIVDVSEYFEALLQRWMHSNAAAEAGATVVVVKTSSMREAKHFAVALLYWHTVVHRTGFFQPYLFPYLEQFMQAPGLVMGVLETSEKYMLKNWEAFVVQIASTFMFRAWVNVLTRMLPNEPGNTLRMLCYRELMYTHQYISSSPAKSAWLATPGGCWSNLRQVFVCSQCFDDLLQLTGATTPGSDVLVDALVGDFLDLDLVWAEPERLLHVLVASEYSFIEMVLRTCTSLSEDTVISTIFLWACDVNISQWAQCADAMPTAAAMYLSKGPTPRRAPLMLDLLKCTCRLNNVSRIFGTDVLRRFPGYVHDKDLVRFASLLMMDSFNSTFRHHHRLAPRRMRCYHHPQPSASHDIKRRHGGHCYSVVLHAEVSITYMAQHQDEELLRRRGVRNVSRITVNARPAFLGGFVYQPFVVVMKTGVSKEVHVGCRVLIPGVDSSHFGVLLDVMVKHPGVLSMHGVEYTYLYGMSTSFDASFALLHAPVACVAPHQKLFSTSRRDDVRFEFHIRRRAKV